MQHMELQDPRCVICQSHKACIIVSFYVIEAILHFSVKQVFGSIKIFYIQLNAEAVVIITMLSIHLVINFHRIKG